MNTKGMPAIRETELAKLLLSIQRWKWWALVISGIVLLALFLLLVFWPTDNFGHTFLANGEEKLISFIAIIIAAIVLLLPSIRVLSAIVDFFDKTLSSEIGMVVETHQKEIEDILLHQKTEMQNLIDTQKSLLAPRALKTILDSISYEDGIELLPLMYAKVYGSHCASPKGLYSFLHNGMHKFMLPDVQHFSSYNKSINLALSSDGKMIFREFTTYSIHLISLDEDYEKPISQSKDSAHIEYKAENTFDTTQNLEEYIKGNTFQISVRDSQTGSLVSIFDLKQLQIESDDKAIFEPENTSVSKIDDSKPFASLRIIKTIDGINTIKLVMNCRYKAESAHVFVRTDETTIIEDDHYRFTFSKPSCECAISINIPQEYKFKYCKTTNSCQWETSKDQDVADTLPNLFKAHTRDWVLPGVVFSCAWEPNIVDPISDKN